ncbi:hypothetical protein IVA79_31500 [Bradyrhizobium sp. 138]|uniref:transcriptional regulator domain-containing protein n=1 Tax=Bradyrhizobium sp. 138 TaxID=2782615 RepID=UPI001FFAB151|nr:DUF6499 domain-containing protein [Bradyrhizobium sp. 138]MCK1738383.1 hypothetical protein [Bradyrhizobium sp. 138]
MSDFDWRSTESYQRAITSGEIEDFAWECLRRNPEYQRAYRNARSKRGQVTSDFRRRWGVCFRS